MQNLAKAVAGLWQNQQSIDHVMKKLAASEQSLDDQVAVLTRLFFVEVNRIREAHDELPLDLEGVEPVFTDWAKFRARPDANEHMPHWVFGKPLDELPPPPEPEQSAKKEFLEDDISILQEGIDLPENAESDSEYPEGATIFGGDYVASDHGDEEAGQGEPKDETSGESDEMPVLQPQDAPDGEDEKDSSDVSEMSA